MSVCEVGLGSCLVGCEVHDGEGGRKRAMPCMLAFCLDARLCHLNGDVIDHLLFVCGIEEARLIGCLFSLLLEC